MTEMIEIGFFMLLVLFLEVLHYRERKDLYSRLMARTLTEFSAHTTEEMKLNRKMEEKPRNTVVF